MKQVKHHNGFIYYTKYKVFLSHIKYNLSKKNAFQMGSRDTMSDSLCPSLDANL